MPKEFNPVPTRDEIKSLIPHVGRGGHVRRWARYHRLANLAPVKVNHPEKYLNASARRKVR
jgi:hypothetical protein